LGWFLYRSDLSVVWGSLARLSAIALLAAAALSLLALLVAGYKWHLLLPDVPLRTLQRLTFVAVYYSVLLPGQLAGEAVKAYRLGKGRIDAEEVAMSVVVDKLTSLYALAIVALAGLSLGQRHTPTALYLALLALLAAGAALVFLARSRRLLSLLTKLGSAVAVRFPLVRRPAAQFVRLCGAWHRFGHRPGSVALSVLIGAGFHLIVVGIHLVLAAEMTLAVSFADWGWIYAIVSLAMLLPLSIGGFGIREGTYVGILQLFQVPAEQALVFSLALGSLLLFNAAVGMVLEIGTTRIRSASR
jgi:hypothetical protein